MSATQRRLTALILSTTCLVSGALAQGPDEASPNAFKAEHVFDLEYAASPQISPDGKTIVYARRSADRLNDRFVGDLWTIDVASGEHRPLPGGEGVSSARWSPTGDRLLYLSSAGSGPELRVHYFDTHESHSLAQLERSPSAPQWSPNGEAIAFSMFVPAKPPSFATSPDKPEGADWAEPVRVFDDLRIRSDGRGYLEEGARHVFVLPAEGGTPRAVTDGDNDFSSPQWLDDRTLLVVGNDVENPELDPIESEIYRVDIASGERRALTNRDGPDRAPLPSPNGDRIAYLGYDDKVMFTQETDLYVMGPDGSEPRNLTGAFDRSIGGVVWRPNGSGLIAEVERDGALTLVSIPLSGEPMELLADMGGAGLGRPYASGAFSVAARAQGDAPLIAYTKSGGPQAPSDVGLFDGSGATKTLTALNDDVLPFIDLAEVEEIKVASSHDGREIEAWVALPPGFKADGSHPMILEIHGGPVSMYGPFFSPEVQRYAAEGYVTVYANPRGSSGYGEEFAQLINLAYPGNDYDDLMSVVDHLIEEQYVDPQRLFVTGGSGGGVLTAWIVGKTPRFAAAACIKPVINWTSMALAADIGQYVARHWMQAMPWENRDRYWSLSPISLVGNVRTPTLVMVGEEDWRTPSWEAEQFYTALKMQKVDSALIRVPGAAHFIARRPSQLIAKTNNILGWFAKYDAAGQAGEPAGD